MNISNVNKQHSLHGKNLCQTARPAMRATRRILLLIAGVCLFSAFAAAQGGFVLVNDSVSTGPLKAVKKNVILNDKIPCNNYTWRIITQLNASTQGTAVKSGDFITFTPGPNCRNAKVDIQYGVTCNGMEKIAVFVVEVSQYNWPVNIIDKKTECASDMATINFNAELKYRTSTDLKLDGFAMPLVGDLNGDGKPEIVALGLGRKAGEYSYGWLEARAWYIHIFDGQTGARLWSVNMGTEPSSGGVGSKVNSLGHDGITSGMIEESDQFQIRYWPRHNSPGHLAIADLNGDGKVEIVVVETGNKGKMYALTPTLNADKSFNGFSELWSIATTYKATQAKYIDESDQNKIKDANYSSEVKANNHELFGAGIPYIADLNGDGRPEVLVYNKIYDGVTGALVEKLDELYAFAHPKTDVQVTKAREEYAYVGRQPMTTEGDMFTPCMAIADVDGDGILDIVAGSKVYKMKHDQATGRPKLASKIYGPSKVTVTVREGTGSPKSATHYLADGFTVVADIDMDGKLDVIVINMVGKNGDDNKYYMIYVWDPSINNPNQTPKAAMLIYEDGNTGHLSFPLVGDINGFYDNTDKTKRMPELCFMTGRLYTQSAAANAIQSTPVKVHPDRTGSNGETHLLNVNGCAGNRYFNKNTDFSKTGGFVLGFTWDDKSGVAKEERLKLSFALEITDQSHMTGITMFDFDNDGAMDLAYKDETRLRVISPSRQSYICYDKDSPAVRFNQSGIYSFTGYEAPVIADVNMDGSADILTMNHDETNERSYGYVYVWQHKSGTPKWAPCPPVWNQTIYNPLYINSDLSVPAKPQSMLTPYQDKDGKTIYPYNTQWVQQPIVRADERYKPVVRKPDAILMKMELIESGNKARLTIRNAGSATINANTPITFYNGGSNGVAPASGNKIVEKPVGVDIFPEETYTRDYDLGVDIKNKLIHARIMDSNNKFPADNYTDCELSNNVIATAYCPELAYSITASSNKICADGGTVTLTAKKDGTLNAATYKWYHDDVEINSATGSTYAATQAGRYTCYVTSGAICRTHSSEKIITLEQKNAINDAITLDALAPTSINVIANDYIPASCTSPNVNIIVQPKHGVATVVGNQIEYTSTVNADIKDTLAYSLTADATIWAELYIVIKSVPVPVAVNDYATVFACYPRTVKALANDYDATGGTVKIVTDGKLGTATLAGSNSDEIQYTASKGSNCFANGGKNDTVTYSICLGNVCNAEGKLIMTVLRLPYIMLMDKCSHRPYLTPAYQYHGATYQWYSAPKNAPTAWQPVSGGAGAGMKLYVTAEAYYKLEVTYNGEVVETQPVHFVINRQAKLPTGIWYDSTLN